MSSHESETGSSEGRDATSDVHVAVWFTTKNPVLDEFAIEIVGVEVWQPKREAWEVKHTFSGLVPDAPYTLRIHTGDPGSEPIDINFWTTGPRDETREFPDWRIELQDTEIITLHPGFRSHESRYPRMLPLTRLGRANDFWRRRGFAAIVAIIVAAAMVSALISAVSDSDGNAEDDRPSLNSNDSISITYRATSFDGSAEMMVEREIHGASEQHVVSDQVWEDTRSGALTRLVALSVQNRSDIGAVRCELFINGELWITATSSGPEVVARCEGYPSELLR